MKKLFISVPMKGRTEENIRKSMAKMHKIAEIVFDQELEVIESYIEDNPPENAKQAVWFLGESIKKLSEADYFIGIEWSPCWKGCDIETDVARAYGIPVTCVKFEDLMPDCVEIERDYWETSRECTPGPIGG